VQIFVCFALSVSLAAIAQAERKSAMVRMSACSRQGFVKTQSSNSSAYIARKSGFAAKFYNLFSHPRKPARESNSGS
jgi:hypothetical protein